MEQLRFDIVRRDDEIYVELSGALDLATRPTFAHVADDVLGEDGRRIVFDLSALDFMDSTGIVELIRAARRAEEKGVPVRFIGPKDGAARRTADVVGLERILGWSDPVEG
jgi:anti-anti-sigma factor